MTNRKLVAWAAKLGIILAVGLLWGYWRDRSPGGGSIDWTQTTPRTVFMVVAVVTVDYLFGRGKSLKEATTESLSGRRH